MHYRDLSGALFVLLARSIGVAPAGWCVAGQTVSTRPVEVRGHETGGGRDGVECVGVNVNVDGGRLCVKCLCVCGLYGRGICGCVSVVAGGLVLCGSVGAESVGRCRCGLVCGGWIGVEFVCLWSLVDWFVVAVWARISVDAGRWSRRALGRLSVWYVYWLVHKF